MSPFAGAWMASDNETTDLFVPSLVVPDGMGRFGPISHRDLWLFLDIPAMPACLAAAFGLRWAPTAHPSLDLGDPAGAGPVVLWWSCWHPLPRGA